MLQQDIFFIESLASLYRDVQLQEVFPDSKYFVDCEPIGNPAAIAGAYEIGKQQQGFSLKNFVSAHFIFPVKTASDYVSASKPILQHLHDLWEVLTRQPAAAAGTLIPLPHPYIVPGGRFREVYYWDSYFTMLGLQVSNRFDIIENMLANFAYLIDQFGFIPNANRTYYLGRSQPPFFSLMLVLLAEEKGAQVLLQYRPQLEKEYAFWMDGSAHLTDEKNTHRRVVKLPGDNLLNRYWDDNDTPRPEAYTEDIRLAQKTGSDDAIVYRHIRAAAESGWDFSSRWFKDGRQMTTIETTHLIPVDLNCLLLHAEEILHKIYSLLKEPDLVSVFSEKINARKKAIQQFCFSESKGFYFDYNFIEHTQCKHFTLAAAYPLFFKVADARQAAQVARVLEENFLQQGGLLTTLNNTGQQWDAPNGWAPLQWMAWNGLKNYGHHRLAAEIKARWMTVNEKVYAATGKMMEKYNVADTTTQAGGGEYPNQDGFGWTNGVYLKLEQDSQAFHG
ncbi:MAG: alpha,alpha-trehalase TreF [Chitinophagaceae bacterium]